MDKLGARVEQAIEEKVFPGCVIGTIAGNTVDIRAYGTLAYDDTPTTQDTVYDLASITKSIPLAALVSLLCAEGKIHLSDLAKQYVSDLASDHDATIEDLLRYRVKGTQLSTLHYGTFEQIRAEALERGFDGPPGAFQYTNLPALVLGLVVERVAGSTLPALAQKHFFEPLGMAHTTFFPAAGECAPTEVVGGETIQGIPHDESARVFARDGRAAGHAGLFSSAGDLLKFAAHMIAEKDMPITRDAIAGLGWQVADANFMGSRAGAHVCGKTGFTGTSIMIDIERELALVILSNRTYPQRPKDDAAIFAFRRDIADMVFG